MKTGSTEKNAAERLLCSREVAEMLCVHVKTVYRFAGKGGARPLRQYESAPGYRPLPCVYVGGRLRFKLSDVTSWIRQRKEAGNCRSTHED